MGYFFYFLVFFFGLCVPNLFATKLPKNQNKEFNIMSSRERAGLFSIFNDVLAMLKCYEQGYYRGIEIDFGTHGVYYDSSYGPNWWSYYCEPVCYGEKNNVKKIFGDPPFSIPWQTEKYTSRKEAFKLIQKYIFIKPHIQNKINHFEKDNFLESYVIGVHYRGTDKVNEAPAVTYERVVLEIQKQMESKNSEDYKIFLATDEQKFIDYLVSVFGDTVCYNKDALRANDDEPLHLSEKYDHYKRGEDAIVDAVLLSRTNILIRMSSNLSLWSTFFNPNLKVIELNKRY